LERPCARSDGKESKTRRQIIELRKVFIFVSPTILRT
jgi:hypothetical protein